MCSAIELKVWPDPPVTRRVLQGMNSKIAMASRAHNVSLAAGIRAAFVSAYTEQEVHQCRGVQQMTQGADCGHRGLSDSCRVPCQIELERRRLTE